MGTGRLFYGERATGCVASPDPLPCSLLPHLPTCSTMHRTRMRFAMRWTIALLGLAVGNWGSGLAVQSSEPGAIKFELDVQPILTARGCNSGPCHGKSRGQNGFALSLLGLTPTWTFARSSPMVVGAAWPRPHPTRACFFRRPSARCPTVVESASIWTAPTMGSWRDGSKGVSNARGKPTRSFAGFAFHPNPGHSLLAKTLR
jgi:hypothetical protein